MDTRIGTVVYRAFSVWHFGHADEAKELISEATSDAIATGHAGTVASACGVAAVFDVIRGDARTARSAVLISSEVAHKHGMKWYIVLADLVTSWVHGELKNREFGRFEP